MKIGDAYKKLQEGGGESLSIRGGGRRKMVQFEKKKYLSGNNENLESVFSWRYCAQTQVHLVLFSLTADI